MGWIVVPRPGRFTPEKDPVPIVLEPGYVWTGAGNFAATGIRSPDRPARSDSLYPLSYPDLLCTQMSAVNSCVIRTDTVKQM